MNKKSKVTFANIRIRLRKRKYKKCWWSWKWIQSLEENWPIKRKVENSRVLLMTHLFCF
jgi:hypothetical protein